MSLKSVTKLIISFFIFTIVGAASVSAAVRDHNSGLAVVIIDMQYGFYDRGGVWGTEGLINMVEKQKELLAWAKAEQIPVLVFEYEGYADTDADLMALIKNNNYKVVQKSDDNGFESSSKSKKEANQILKEWGVDTLIMGGINGCCCVYGSAIGAIESGYDVMTSSDIVGNINQNPPLYPNSSWFFEDNKFVVYRNLNEIIK